MFLSFWLRGVKVVRCEKKEESSGKDDLAEDFIKVKILLQLKVYGLC